MTTWSKKYTISCHLKNDKDSVENENNRKKNCDYDAKRRSKCSTVDLRNRFIAVIVQKTWQNRQHCGLNKTFHHDLVFFKVCA